MSKSQLRSIFHDHKHYEDSMKLFYETVSNHGDREEWTNTVFRQVVSTKLPRIPEGAPLRVLGVGSGNGKTDYLLITKIKERYPNIDNTAIEPIASHLDKYKALFTAERNNLEGVSTEFKQQTIEEFERENGSSNDKYHFISAVHILYYLRDWQESIRYLYDILADGGVMLIVIISEHGGQTKVLRKTFPEGEEFFKTIDSADLCKVLDKMGVKYERSRTPSRAKVIASYEDETDENNLWWDFLTHTINFRQTAPVELQKSVKELALGPECCDPRQDDGTLLFKFDWEAIIVHK
ncbi:histamine N-methyltransferase-like [Ptychodera flava]|uniref:histamine N-methyltransferase-like n=1 Tax=Ptychodera flava TaxID=63121 RepID=UPI00396A6D54